MDLDRLQSSALVFLQSCPENRVSEEDAIRPELAGMQIYDPPIFGAGAADDPLFKQLQAPGVVGPGALLPTDWLTDAKSVLSFFLPFTEAVRRSNRLPDDKPSDEWLHARIEGQMMLERFAAFLCGQLESEGFSALYPVSDGRFGMIAGFASNWSERHVAHVCGLGTFGLSRGLITKRGMAGRFGSIVTSAPLPPTRREYDSPFEFCILCGKCQKNCPAGAIDVRRGVIHGKDQTLCSSFVYGNTLPPHGPSQRVRFGCGKCQVGVPCESGIPGRAELKASRYSQ